MKRVSLDIETAGTKPGCAVLSIGATVLETGEKFYGQASLVSNLLVGLTTSPETMKWWDEQSIKAQEVLRESQTNIIELLIGFSGWFEDAIDGEKHEVWCWRSPFDSGILRAAYDKVGLPDPLEKSNFLCLYTLAKYSGVAAPERTGTHHNALDDALYQGEYLEKILNERV